MTDQTPPDPQDLKEKLLLETGKIEWQELQKHFAHGVVVVIDAKLDLVQVATYFAEDDSARIEEWTKTGQIARAMDEDARRWNDNNSKFWAVVAAPWVLVQEITAEA